MAITSLSYLYAGRHIGYPNILEHEGHLLVAFATDPKQKIKEVKIKITDLDNLQRIRTKNTTNLYYQLSIFNPHSLTIRR
ncbi:hypothetical protein EHW67_02075 [Arenibacter aquaticus]|uniref:Uncharacterized protein n=1 Tax=Arenibacter aquaticus TaxID=2489054 RepID=A0A430K8U3_9FLAO|nr:hypothetical protein [Arenibacter aquaticus]RTE55379.1 hypothetical protein EHW67_02075 [Arenibacter aquaticus]